MVDLDGAKGFVIADIPGLIEGASEGVGLGLEFLRHIERAKVMIHMVDAAAAKELIYDDLSEIQRKVEAYDPAVFKKAAGHGGANEWMRVYGDDEIIQKLKDTLKKTESVCSILSVSGKVKRNCCTVSESSQASCSKSIVYEPELNPALRSLRIANYGG